MQQQCYKCGFFSLFFFFTFLPARDDRNYFLFKDQPFICSSCLICNLFFATKTMCSSSACRFAAPPVGDNRMRPPQPVTPWSAPLTTTSFGPSCLQMGSPGAFGSHAAWVTLNLNVSKEDCKLVQKYSCARALVLVLGVRV